MTTPIIRCVKLQLEMELHYLVDNRYKSLLEHNPHIYKIHGFDQEWTELKEELKAEDFNLVIDLHKITKTIRLGSFLKKPVIHFHKGTLEKWLMLKFRINKLPSGHLVDRFFDGVGRIKVNDDGKGMELFIDSKSETRTMTILNRLEINEAYTAIVVGGAKWTKQIPIELCVDYINKSTEPIVLVGGPEDIEKSKKIVEYSTRHVNNFAGQYNLLESAIIVRQSKLVITGDTGMMHIAAIYNKPTVVVYGSTSPIFGMYPYSLLKEPLVSFMEPDHLPCWPCSKSGRSKCPKEHARCLFDWKAFDIQRKINKLDIRN